MAGEGRDQGGAVGVWMALRDGVMERTSILQDAEPERVTLCPSNHLTICSASRLMTERCAGQRLLAGDAQLGFLSRDDRDRMGVAVQGETKGSVRSDLWDL